MLILLGVSHHDLDLAALDRVVAAGQRIPEFLLAVQATDDAPIRGAVVLTTCNRVEIYLDAVRFHDAIDLVTAEVGRLTADPDFGARLKVRVGAPVAAHLFTVAAGLDAMVVGEAEISGQVSAALAGAQAAGLASPLLHTLFQAAARVAKQVISTTALGGAGRSIASVAIDLATAGHAVHRAVVIGTGAYARVAATALRARGVPTVQVFSPSGRTATFVSRHGATPIGLDEMPLALAQSDLVVSASGHGVVLTRALVEHALTLNNARLTVVDLALHSDVAPGVAELARVQVTDLHTVAADAGPGHDETLAAAQDLVIAAVARFEDEQTTRTLDPAVIALRRHVSGTVEREMSRLRSKYSDEIAGDVELALHRVTQSLLHTPTLRARELARTGAAADYLQALHVLFGIDIPAAPER